MQDGGSSTRLSLGSIFGGKGPASGTTTNLEPHPSVRDHISPLNRLTPNAAAVSNKEDALPVHPDVRSGVLENGLPYIILPNKSPPGRFEAHLQVFSGSGMQFFRLEGKMWFTCSNILLSYLYVLCS